MTDPYKQADRARWLRDLLCGALIGAGAILPGVSGGVLAVVFDVYRPMMETLAHPGRGIQKYWHIFLPLGIGWAFWVSPRGSAPPMPCRTPLPSGSLSASLPERFLPSGRRRERRAMAGRRGSPAASAPYRCFCRFSMCAMCFT